jgi:hypothetical protein
LNIQDLNESQIDVDGLIARIRDADTDEKKQACIDEYNQYNGYLKTWENILSAYLNKPVETTRHNTGIGIVTMPEPVFTMNPKFLLGDFLNKLRKEPNYKLADVWTWDVTQGSRYYDRILEIVSQSNYRNDKNLFLYNLNNLDPACKKRICETYANFYNLIPNIDEIKVSNAPGAANANRQKFNNINQAFCVEVLLNLAITPQFPIGNADTIIEGFIKKRVAGNFLDVVRPFFNANINYHPLISEVNVIAENGKIIQQPETIISSVNAKDITPQETALQTGGDKYLIDLINIKII